MGREERSQRGARKYQDAARRQREREQAEMQARFGQPEPLYGVENTAYMGEEDAVDEADQPAESMAESEEPPASSAEQPAGSESSGDKPAESDEAPAESSADMPAASSEDGGGRGAESAASSDSMPESLKSSQASSFSNEGSSSDAYMRKISLKKGAQSRYQLYLMCNMFEQAAREILKYAIEEPLEQQKALGVRRELLQALYYLRHVGDCDDEFTLAEFEQEMNTIKIYRAKMQRLAGKEGEDNPTDMDDSSDDELDDADDMELLKEARKLVEHTFGKQVDLYGKRVEPKM